MLLAEGDLIQVGTSGKVQLEYSNGTTVVVPIGTVFSVRRADSGAGKGSVFITSEEVNIVQDPRVSSSATTDPPERTSVRRAAPEASPAAGSEPTLELKKIVRFGRSLELVGRVDPGGSLVVNGETVDIAADGSFKHFTKPFAGSARTVQLVLTAKDLSGRTRRAMVTQDFSSGPGED